ncbi:ABC transporter ATP-binding protein [Thermodesulfobacteriota bacterium]
MIQLSGVTKYFGKLKALDDINIKIESGDVYGFIGPNGAGKSTTLRILAGLALPTAGTILIDGHDMSKKRKEVMKIIGYMPDVYGMYEDMTVYEYLRFFCKASFIDARKIKGIVGDVLELTDLTIKRDANIKELSRGMRQRVCLSRALLHDPKILLLDEPASGLDPKLRIELRELIRALSDMGKTIFISSHILTELSTICNKVGIIEKGRIVTSGSLEEIKKAIKPKKKINMRMIECHDGVCKILDAHESVFDLKDKAELLEFNFAGNDDELHQLLTKMIHDDVKIVSFSEEVIDLEDIFLELTKGEVS